MADQSKHSSLGGFTAGVLATLAVLVVAGLVTVYGGLYNIAATEEHTSAVRWAFDTTFRNSVESGAEGLVPPAEITPAMIEAGAAEYKSACQHCHAGPGVERAEWAAGMRPQPPHLTEAAAEWDLAEVFWLARHGAKMTGMPAFGPSHDDETLWGIAAFVKELPAMDAERYAAFKSEGEGEGEEGQPSRTGGDAGSAAAPAGEPPAGGVDPVRPGAGSVAPEASGPPEVPGSAPAAGQP